MSCCATQRSNLHPTVIVGGAGRIILAPRKPGPPRVGISGWFVQWGRHSSAFWEFLKQATGKAHRVGGRGNSSSGLTQGSAPQGAGGAGPTEEGG